MNKFLIGLLLLSSCVSKPLSTQKTENSDIHYEILFTRHGCEVGRFKDSNYVYVTLCPNGNSSAQWFHSESCGKNCNQTINDFQIQK